jgi:DNA ligase 1
MHDYVARGFEGVMVRDDSANYELGHRSMSLLKLKPFDDDEFEIMDVIPSGKGKAAEVGKFRCITESGVEFSANPVGTAAVRKDYLVRRESLIGQFVTVYYEGFSDDGKPRFARAIAVREGWDR